MLYVMQRTFSPGQLFDLGVISGQPLVLQRKVKLSNQMAVVFAVLTIPYILFTYTTYPPCSSIR